MDTQLEKVYKWLDEHSSAMTDDLFALLAIDSVRTEGKDGMPFGEGPAAALDFCLELGKKQGFETGNMEGYVGTIDLPGKEETQIGILSHVDVVPAEAADWRFPPFSPEISDGLVYARGVIDDKGPLIACQYALKAIKECGVELKRSVRHIIGTNEETGMACIDYFVEHSPILPECGFAPDAVFPVVSGEKGLLRWTCTSSWEADDTGCSIRFNRLTGGSDINSVPASAELELSASDEGFEFIKDACEKSPHTFILQRSGNTVKILASGIAAHASLPEKGDNAILKLLYLLAGLDFAPSGAKKFTGNIILFLEDILKGKEDIPVQDEYSKLTNLLSLSSINASCGEFSCDTRYPVTADGKETEEKLRRLAALYGFSYDCLLAMDSVYYPKEHPLVSTLIDIFKEETGTQAEPIVIGSGTYARKLPCFVAFGPLFPGQENITHQADERMALSDLFKLARIYAAAIIKLANS